MTKIRNNHLSYPLFGVECFIAIFLLKHPIWIISIYAFNQNGISPSSPFHKQCLRTLKTLFITNITQALCWYSKFQNILLSKRKLYKLLINWRNSFCCTNPQKIFICVRDDEITKYKNKQESNNSIKIKLNEHYVPLQIWWT